MTVSTSRAARVWEFARIEKTMGSPAAVLR